MGVVSSRFVRRTVSDNLASFYSRFGCKDGSRFRLADLDDILRMPRKVQACAMKESYGRFSDELSIANLAIVCLALLSASTYDQEAEEELFPRDWLSPTGSPNANFVLECMLRQLTNSALATVQLLERGLDVQARALVRITEELSHQILCLIGIQEDFRYYVSAKDEFQAKQVWHKLFAQGRLQKKLLALERRMGLPEDIALRIRDQRTRDVAFYSQAVHHSYLSVILGSHSWDYDREVYVPGLFGGPTLASEATTDHIAFVLFYFLLGFFRILAHIHDIRPRNPDRCFWDETIALHKSVTDAYIGLRIKIEATEAPQRDDSGRYE